MSDSPKAKQIKLNDTLVFAHVIFRHGQRNIMKSYPKDPYKDEVHWPGGFGQLTNEGKRQLFRLGQHLRRRYDKLLSRNYSPTEIYCQSTDFDRTIMSAQACLAGLYPPTDEQKWHDEIMWQPISVHTVPAKSDHVLLAGNDCPKFDFYHTKYMKESLEFQLVYTDSVRKFREWSMNSGLCITSMFDSCLLYDTLVIEKSFNKTLPEWAEREISPDGLMERFVKLHVKSYTDLPLLARLKSGFILKEMMDRFDQKINSKITEKVWLYSGHDTTIINILNPLGLFKESHIPPYGASLHFELYKTPENQHYFQLFYRKSNEEPEILMNIPGCGEKCTVDRFRRVFAELFPGDFDTECSMASVPGWKR